MEVIIRPKGAGKTTELIKRCAESPGGYIVCRDQLEANRIHLQAIGMGLQIHLPITYFEFIGGHYSPSGVKSLFIDNAEALLQYIARTEIKAISITGYKKGKGASTV